MIENNIIFSLIVSLVNTVAFYLFTSRNKKDIVDHKQEMILLFGISFSTTFLLKTCVESILTNEKTKAEITIEKFQKNKDLDFLYEKKE